MDKFVPKSKTFPEEVEKSIHCVPEVNFSLWNSPIQIIETVPRISHEDGIVNAVKEVGVIVDKERLLMVLSNDRISYAEGYQAGLESAQPKWISVEERLPEDRKNVLAYIASEKEGVNSVIAVTNYSHSLPGFNIEGWVSPWQYCFWDRKVTHWMPLPEPPKEEA